MIDQNTYFHLHLDYYKKILKNTYSDISIFICTHKPFDDSYFLKMMFILY